MSNDFSAATDLGSPWHLNADADKIINATGGLMAHVSWKPAGPAIVAAVNAYGGTAGAELREGEKPAALCLDQAEVAAYEIVEDFAARMPYEDMPSEAKLNDVCRRLVRAVRAHPPAVSSAARVAELETALRDALEDYRSAQYVAARAIMDAFDLARRTGAEMRHADISEKIARIEAALSPSALEPKS